MLSNIKETDAAKADQLKNVVVVDVKEPVPDNGNRWLDYLPTLSTENPFVPFFDPKDNFANILAQFLDTAPTHSGCVLNKARFSLGDGFVIKKGEQNILFAALSKIRQLFDISTGLHDKIKALVGTMNEEDESLLDIAELSFKDFYGFGNVYLHCIRGTVAGERFFTVNHITPPFARYKRHKEPKDKKKKPTHLLVSTSFDPIYLSTNKPETIPIFNPTRPDISWEPREGFESFAEHTVIILKNKSARRKNYGLPDSIASLLYNQLEYKIPRYNTDRIDNNFVPSAMVQFFGQQSDEANKKFLKKFQSTFTGDGKRGRIFAQVLGDKNMEANVHKFEDKSDGAWSDLDKISTSKILAAHRMHPALAGQFTPGSLGTTKEIQDAYNLIYKTEIRPNKNKILSRTINRILRMKADWLAVNIENAYLDIPDYSPFELANEIDVNRVLTVDEGREAIGREPHPVKEKGEKIIIEDKKRQNAE